MASGRRVAGRIDSGWDWYVFLPVCAAVPAGVAAVSRTRRTDASGPRSSADSSSLLHVRNSLVRRGRAESRGTDADSDLRGGRVIRRQIRAGVDVDVAAQSADSEQ